MSTKKSATKKAAKKAAPKKTTGKKTATKKAAPKKKEAPEEPPRKKAKKVPSSGIILHLNSSQIIADPVKNDRKKGNEQAVRDTITEDFRQSFASGQEEPVKGYFDGTLNDDNEPVFQLMSGFRRFYAITDNEKKGFEMAPWEGQDEFRIAAIATPPNEDENIRRVRAVKANMHKEWAAKDRIAVYASLLQDGMKKAELARQLGMTQQTLYAYTNVAKDSTMMKKIELQQIDPTVASLLINKVSSINTAREKEGLEPIKTSDFWARAFSGKKVSRGQVTTTAKSYGLSQQADVAGDPEAPEAPEGGANVPPAPKGGNSLSDIIDGTANKLAKKASKDEDDAFTTMMSELFEDLTAVGADPRKMTPKHLLKSIAELGKSYKVEFIFDDEEEE